MTIIAAMLVMVQFAVMANVAGQLALTLSVTWVNVVMLQQTVSWLLVLIFQHVASPMERLALMWESAAIGMPSVKKAQTNVAFQMAMIVQFLRIVAVGYVILEHVDAGIFKKYVQLWKTAVDLGLLMYLVRCQAVAVVRLIAV